jgi:hypothetical protein
LSTISKKDGGPRMIVGSSVLINWNIRSGATMVASQPCSNAVYNRCRC